MCIHIRFFNQSIVLIATIIVGIHCLFIFIFIISSTITLELKNTRSFEPFWIVNNHISFTILILSSRAIRRLISWCSACAIRKSFSCCSACAIRKSFSCCSACAIRKSFSCCSVCWCRNCGRLNSLDRLAA